MEEELRSLTESEGCTNQNLMMVSAIVQPWNLDAVAQELDRVGIYGMTVFEVLGRGAQRPSPRFYRGLKETCTFLHKVKIEIAVEEELVDHVIDAILRSARSNGRGSIGDGKIFVTRIAEVVRIRTGQVNGAAL